MKTVTEKELTAAQRRKDVDNNRPINELATDDRPNGLLCGLLKTFPLRVILTVTTDRLLTEPKDGGNGIGDLYAILNHMTQDNLFTHQLGRASEECKPWLLRWYPELAACGVDKSMDSLDRWLNADRVGGSEAVRMWLTELKMMFPNLRDEYEIGQLPADDHEVKDAFDELVEMRGTDELIILIDTDCNLST